MVSERVARRGRAALGTAVLLTIAACSTSAALADVGDPAPPIEQGFVSAINEIRTSEGVGQLVVDDGLEEAARGWAAEMVSKRELAHAPDITSGVPLGWTKAGENVGRGDTVAGLMTAFMNSPGHRRNVLDPSFSHIGVGSFVTEEGVLYTTHRFVDAPMLSTTVPQLGTAVEVDCPGGHGRVVATLTNSGDQPYDVSVLIGSQASQNTTIEAGGVERIEASFQPDGQVDVVARAGSEVFFAEVATVACQAG